MSTKIITPNGTEMLVDDAMAISLLNGGDTRYKLADGEADPRSTTPLEDAEERARLQAAAEGPNTFQAERGQDKNLNYTLASGEADTAPGITDVPEPVATGDADDEAQPPAGNASRAEWEAYAISQGYTAESLARYGRDDIRELVTDE